MKHIILVFILLSLTFSVFPRHAASYMMQLGNKIYKICVEVSWSFVPNFPIGVSLWRNITVIK